MIKEDSGNISLLLIFFMLNVANYMFRW